MAQAIFIDAEKHDLRYVELSDAESCVDEMRELLGGHVELAFRWNMDAFLFVDEEGFLKPTQHFFRITWRTDQPFAGHGIVVGRERFVDNNPAGKWIGHHPLPFGIDWLRPHIGWLSREQFNAWARANASEPSVRLTVIGGGGKPVSSTLETFGRYADPIKREKK